jgi:hypothetical protein
MTSPMPPQQAIFPEDLVLQQMMQLTTAIRDWHGEALARGNIPLTPDFLEKPVKAIGGGMWKGFFETNGFLLGEPAEEDKSDFRRTVEAEAASSETSAPAAASPSGSPRW